LDNRLSTQEKKSYINRLLTERYIRLQPHRLMNKVKKAFPDQSRTQIRTIIKTMVAEGVLVYTYELSSTFIVRNPKTGLQVRTALPQTSEVSQAKRCPQTIPIHLTGGLAFGYGEHPTTQLCLQGIETALKIGRKANPGRHLTVLDIGTGSGVLAIAAALLGADKVVAIDTDPMACREAQINIDLNRVSGKISVVAGDMTVLKGSTFDVVVANLRGPTLKRIVGQISEGITIGGVCVYSGFRPNESNVITTVFRSPHWKIIWDSHSRGWAAVTVQRQSDS